MLAIILSLLLLVTLAPKEEIARDQINAFLHKFDINIDFDIASITHKEVIFQNIALLPERAVTAKKLVVRYSIPRLVNMEADEILIYSPEIHLKKTDTGSTLPGLERYISDEAEDIKEEAEYTTPTLPFNSLTITDGVITVPMDEQRTLSMGLSSHISNKLTGKISLHQFTLPLENGEIIVLPLATVSRSEANAPFRLHVDDVYHATTKKPWFTPLFLNGEILPDFETGVFKGSATLTSMFPDWRVDMETEGTLSPFSFRLKAKQPPLNFATGVIQPDNLFPVVRGYAEQVYGTVALEAELNMKAGEKLQSHGSVMLKDLSGTISKVAIERINGNLHFDSLTPPAIHKRQHVSVDGIMLGLPLYNGQFSFTLKEDGTLTFHGNKWQWAGGYVHTTGLTSNIYNFKPPKTTLYAKNVDVADLLSGLLKQGISAEGTVSGELPVSFTEDAKIMIIDGFLISDGPGRIIYTPGEHSPLQRGQSFQTDLLLQAVRNFHYDKFSLRLNSTNENHMTIAMHLSGRNPESFDGQKVELNINLEGNLIDILLSSMDIYALPSRLQEQINQ